MSPNLDRISRKARANPDLVFTSLYHHIADIDHLRTCYQLLKGNKAVGIDEVSKSMYAEDLEANLHDLSARLKRMGYRPQPKLRVYIPKPGSEKGRPLGMSSFEDKIVELATKRVVEPLFESLFEECSYGYRPERSPHQCLDVLGRTLQQQRVNHVVEADIRGFFDAVHHEWLLKFLRQRIGDERVLRLIGRMLKAGIMEDGLVQAAEVGTPQGSILSPLLSNVYLHYVLDIWFQRRVCRQGQGQAYLFRFADDFVACFQYQPDAESFLESLGHRMEGFHLELAEEKTQRLEFGRYARVNAYRRGEKTQGLRVPGHDLLLWQNPSWRVQGQAQDFSQETEAVTGSVYGLDTSIPQPPAHGRTASWGQGADSGSSELLCHHGQLRELQAVWASDASGTVRMAQSAEPTQVVYLAGLPTGHEACGMAAGASARQPEPFCTAEWLNEEPDVGNLLVRFCEGLRHNWCMAEIMWHRRETRRQTENTNVMPVALEGLILLDKKSRGLVGVVFQQSTQSFARVNWV